MKVSFTSDSIDKIVNTAKSLGSVHTELIKIRDTFKKMEKEEFDDRTKLDTYIDNMGFTYGEKDVAGKRYDVKHSKFKARVISIMDVNDKQEAATKVENLIKRALDPERLRRIIKAETDDDDENN